MRSTFFTLLLCAFLIGCGPPPPKNVATPTPVPSPSFPAEPERIQKVTNVSFSTYSKDWPVGWEFVDPDSKYAPTPHSIKTGTLKMQVPSRKDLYGDNRTAPRYVKAIAGDFSIETRVKFLPKSDYQGAGLLIFFNDNNYLRFERAYGGVGGGADGIRVDVRTGDSYTPLATPNDIQTEAMQVDLRIVREGQKFSTYWRVNEKSDWQFTREFVSNYPETILAGLIACNTASEITVEFAYIKLLPLPKK